jgi:hypothetical protein
VWNVPNSIDILKGKLLEIYNFNNNFFSQIFQLVEENLKITVTVMLSAIYLIRGSIWCSGFWIILRKVFVVCVNFSLFDTLMRWRLVDSAKCKSRHRSANWQTLFQHAKSVKQSVICVQLIWDNLGQTMRFFFSLLASTHTHIDTYLWSWQFHYMILMHYAESASCPFTYGI